MEAISRIILEMFSRLKFIIFGSRGSDMPITCSGDNQVPLSVRDVLADDDLLTEILLRLPVISALSFKSVSKRWLSLITDPSFTLRRSKIHDLNTQTGFFIRKPPLSSSVQNISFQYDYVPYDIRTSHKLITAFPFVSQGNVEIVQSCNGLLLCFVHPEEFYVYNPTLNRFKRIPQWPFWECNFGMRLVFNPSKSPHYRIMRAGIGNLYSYSSETHSWSTCGDRFSFENRSSFVTGVYCHDSIHWLDAIGAFHYKLDVDRLLVTSIRTPLTFDAESHPKSCKLFASDDDLFLVCIVTRLKFVYSDYLEVYKIRNGYSEWSLKYQVSLESITRRFTKTWNIFTESLPSELLGIVVGEREEDLFIVMRLSGQVVKYRFVSKTLDVLFDLGPVPLIEPTVTSSSSCFPFIASFAAV